MRKPESATAHPKTSVRSLGLRHFLSSAQENVLRDGRLKVTQYGEVSKHKIMETATDNFQLLCCHMHNNYSDGYIHAVMDTQLLNR